MNATTVSINASHASYVSHPNEKLEILIPTQLKFQIHLSGHGFYVKNDSQISGPEFYVKNDSQTSGVDDITSWF